MYIVFLPQWAPIWPPVKTLPPSSRQIKFITTFLTAGSQVPVAVKLLCTLRKATSANLWFSQSAICNTASAITSCSRCWQLVVGSPSWSCRPLLLYLFRHLDSHRMHRRWTQNKNTASVGKWRWMSEIGVIQEAVQSLNKCGRTQCGITDWYARIHMNDTRKLGNDPDLCTILLSRSTEPSCWKWEQIPAGWQQLTSPRKPLAGPPAACTQTSSGHTGDTHSLRLDDIIPALGASVLKN